jgi:DNA replication licensing factor MCM7
MECSKASLNDEDDEEVEPDRSAASKILRIIKSMAQPKTRSRKVRKLGKGPGGERDMDVDEDEDDDDEDEDDDDEDDELSLVDIRARVLGHGFTEAQLNETISEVCATLEATRKLLNIAEQYENLDVWMRVANGSKLRFIST